MTNHRPQGATLVILAALALTAFAGCIADEAEPANRAPIATLQADRTERWTNEAFAFNASGSEDPDGEIVHYLIDFGDGNTYETTDAEDAKNVRHSYAQPGTYEVTLTITDNGENQTTDGNETPPGNRTMDKENDTMSKQDTANVRVVVNEREALAPQALLASPVSDRASRAEHPFDVNAHASHYELDATVQSTLAAGSSSVTLRILDPHGDTIEEQNVTVQAGEEVQLNLTAPLPAKGGYLVEMIATSGAALVGGELRVYYASAETDAA